jgi:hypothetical protein
VPFDGELEPDTRSSPFRRRIYEWLRISFRYQSPKPPKNAATTVCETGNGLRNCFPWAMQCALRHIRHGDFCGQELSPRTDAAATDDAMSSKHTHCP